MPASADQGLVDRTQAGASHGQHAIWIVIGVATGGAWIFYFADAPTLLVDLFTGRRRAGRLHHRRASSPPRPTPSAA